MEQCARRAHRRDERHCRRRDAHPPSRFSRERARGRLADRAGPSPRRFLAVPGAPMPDLLSSATALHALAAMDRRLSSSCTSAAWIFLIRFGRQERVPRPLGGRAPGCRYTFLRLAGAGTLSLSQRSGEGSVAKRSCCGSLIVKRLNYEQTESNCLSEPSCGWSQGVRAVLRNMICLRRPRHHHDPVQRQEMIEKSGQMLSPCVEINETCYPISAAMKWRPICWPTDSSHRRTARRKRPRIRPARRMSR